MSVTPALGLETGRPQSSWPDSIGKKVNFCFNEGLSFKAIRQEAIEEDTGWLVLPSV